MANKSNPKPGGEGLPYKKASEVIGGPPDGNPETGMKPEKGVKGESEVKAPKGK